MIETLFSMIFLVFSFPPVQACCCMTFVVCIFGLIRRFMTLDFERKVS